MDKNISSAKKYLHSLGFTYVKIFKSKNKDSGVGYVVCKNHVEYMFQFECHIQLENFKNIDNLRVEELDSKSKIILNAIRKIKKLKNQVSSLHMDKMMLTNKGKACQTEKEYIILENDDLSF